MSYVSWARAENGYVPAGAIKGGVEDGQTVYVCSARSPGPQKQFMPGKLDSLHGFCYVPFWSEEVGRKEYKVAVGTGSWMAYQNGDYPSDAVVGGADALTTGYKYLQICRVHTKNNNLIPGLLYKQQGGCYFGYGSHVYFSKNYEVLVNISSNQVESKFDNISQ